ncbi:MAG: TIGR04551 family protein [bacterium]|nr:TIGR04551 family protein [bacterium]
MYFRFSLFLCFLNLAFIVNATSELPLPDFLQTTDDSVPVQLSNDEVNTLKQRIKNEILDELNSNEVDWKKNLVKPQLNFLELGGYFRLRTEAFNGCDLGTFSLPSGPGTSKCLPPLSYFKSEQDGDDEAKSSWLLSANMRFRVNPILNISEDIRIKGSVDVFDNLVLGSTPQYMTGLDKASQSVPYSFLSNSQNYPLIGVNSAYGSINVKRLWGEVTTPAGELRFGRMPINFGLGLLFNSGDDDTRDYSTSHDGVMFITRVFGHYLIPGAFVSYAGPTGKGVDVNGKLALDVNQAQRYDLDPADNVYSFILSMVKKDKMLDAKVLLDEGKVVFNYGAMLAYSFQLQDSKYLKLYSQGISEPNLAKESQIVQRNAHMGSLSLWSDVQYDRLQIEAEGVLSLAYIGDATALEGLVSKQVLLRGGFALKSKYSFLNKRLFAGLDGGFASGGHKDKYLNFNFNPDYKIDMLLFEQVLGNINGAYYAKPHITYLFTPNLGVRLDGIVSFATNADLTTGKSNLLGVEFDASAFYQSDDGFHLMLKYGLLIPLAALNHPAANDEKFTKYGTAKTASALQLFMGINF